MRTDQKRNARAPKPAISRELLKRIRAGTASCPFCGCRGDRPNEVTIAAGDLNHNLSRPTKPVVKPTRPLTPESYSDSFYKELLSQSKLENKKLYRKVQELETLLAKLRRIIAKLQVPLSAPLQPVETSAPIGTTRRRAEIEAGQ